MKKIILFLVTSLICSVGWADNVVKSPDGHIILSFDVKDSRPCYSVTYDGTTMLEAQT